MESTSALRGVASMFTLVAHAAVLLYVQSGCTGPQVFGLRWR